MVGIVAAKTLHATPTTVSPLSPLMVVEPRGTIHDYLRGSANPGVELPSPAIVLTASAAAELAT